MRTLPRLNTFPTSASSSAEVGSLLFTAINNVEVGLPATGSATQPIYINSSGKPTTCSYSIGTAASYGVTTSVTSGSSSLVTSGAVYDAINSMRTSLESATASAYFSRYSLYGSCTINLASGVTSANCTIYWTYSWNSYSQSINTTMCYGYFGSSYGKTDVQITSSPYTFSTLMAHAENSYMQNTKYRGSVDFVIKCGTQVIQCHANC